MELTELLSEQAKQITALTLQNAELTAAFGRFFAPKNTNKGNTEMRKLKYGQGSVVKRQRLNKNGSIYTWYEAKWIDEYGKRCSTATKTQKGAYALLEELNPRAYKSHRKHQRSFGQYLREWYQTFGSAECGPERNKLNLTQISRIPDEIMNKALSQITAIELNSS